MSIHRRITGLFGMAAGVLILALMPGAALAQGLVEIHNVQMQTGGSLTWDSLNGANGYNVYEGDVAGLPSGNYGACLTGSAQSTTVTPAPIPVPAGKAIFFLVSGENESGEGPVATAPGASPSQRCVPARRIFALIPNGDPGDGIADGSAPLRNSDARLHVTHRESSGVYLHSGEFFLEASDLWGPFWKWQIGGDSSSADPFWKWQIGPDSSSADPFWKWQIGPDSSSADPFWKWQIGGDSSSADPFWKWQIGGDSSSTDPFWKWQIGAGSSGPCFDCLGGGLPASPSLMARSGSYLLARSYRSQVHYDGPLGQGWEFPANARLVPAGGNAVYFDGTGRREIWTRLDATHFAPVPGRYALLFQNGDGTFTLRDRDGSLQNFHAFDGSSRQGVLESAQDRVGNRVTCHYDFQGLLTDVVDPLGRSLHYAYNGQGRIASITDFAGRQVVYSYDAVGNLVSVRSPIVTGTPNGNDFPSGRTTQYLYSGGFADARLNNNIIGVILPDESGGGAPAIQVSYGTDAGSFNFDRVVSETIGGVNGSGVAAGGTLTFSYQALNVGANPTDPTIPRRLATVLDRNGNEKQLVHNAAGNCLTLTEYTNRGLRPGEPDYTTQFSYDSDGELILVLRPQGDRTQFLYDKPGADRYREGNLLTRQDFPDPVALGGRGDGHGGESNSRVWTYRYEPVFNQIASFTDPRGNDPSYVPQNGGANTVGRYTTFWTYDYQEGDPSLNGILAYAGRFGIDLSGAQFGLGDVNGDGSVMVSGGNHIRIIPPQINLAPGSSQAAINGPIQSIQTTITWNAHGQPIAVTDSEQNQHEIQYYPETDPDGDGTPTPPPLDGRVLDPATGGFLKTELIDTAQAPGRDNGISPAPIDIQYDMKYDAFGTPAALIDGRGVETRTIYNALGELVEVRQAAATADGSGPDGTPPTGRGETGLTPFGFLQRFAYDADGNLVTIQSEDRGATRGVGPFVTINRTFDILGDLVRSDRPASASTTLTTLYVYDANQNLVRLTEPDGNSRDRAYDERDLLLSSTRGAAGPLGGTPSIRRYDFDGDGDLARLTDGRAGITDYLYDGHDRLARTVDAIGGTLDRFYDPASALVRLLARGTSGGPTPTDRSGSANVDLSDTRMLYDEGRRRFRTDDMLFVPAGVLPGRPLMISEGGLLPGDGAVNTIFEYDRLSRLTFVHKDSGAVTRLDYDGAGMMIRRTDPAGDTTDWTYDAASHAVESVETEVLSNPGPNQDQFLTTFFYDALGRLTMAVDNIGQTSRALYDSLGALVTSSDANGPSGGSITRRSPGFTGTSVSINGHGNVTRNTYDAASRLLTSARVLTASGKGDGTTSPPPDTSNPFNPDGLITGTRAWSGDGLLLQALDDKGNPTSYAYDNLDRRVRVTRADGTQTQFGYDGEDALVSSLDPNGTAVVSSIDFAGRLAARSITPARGVAGTTTQTFQHDGLSRLTRAVDPNQPGTADDTNVTFIHDSLGRLLEEAQLPAGLEGGATLYSDLAWQAADLVTGLTYPDGDQVMYGYDGADRLRTMNDTMHPELMATFDYFGMSRLATRTFGNGIRLTFLDDTGTQDVGYDGARRPILMRHLDSSNTLLAGFEYRYDRIGNITSTRRLHDASAATGGVRGDLYSHDSAGRLVASLEAYLDANHNPVSTPSDQEAWSLDGPGNWATLTRNGTLYKNTPNNLNEYDEAQCCGTHTEDGIADDFLDVASTPLPDGLNLTYDKNGNQTDTVRQFLAYNFADRPVGATDLTLGSQVAAYAYDALGRRTRRVVTGGEGSQGTTLEAHAGGLSGDAIEEDDGFGFLRVQHGVGPGGGCLWHLHGDGSSQYVLEDALGSSVALVPAFAAGGGGVLERVVYDSHGKPTFEDPFNNPVMTPGGGPFLAESQYGNDHLFRGLHYDPELGARGTSVNTDFGGLYAGGGIYNPNEGRPMSGGARIAVEKQPGPIQSPVSVWKAPGPPSSPIVGPAGGEIFTDKYGRVKVQFHWDRQGQKDANSSCWIKVGTIWAGKGWGAIHIPRVGKEVIVEFLEGDPDRPLVIPRAYSGMNYRYQSSIPSGGRPSRSAISTAFATAIDWLGLKDEGPGESISFVYGGFDIHYTKQTDPGSCQEWAGVPDDPTSGEAENDPNDPNN